MSTDAQLVGVTLDERYQITRLMGEGGMGQVYEGFHVSLERKVAVKVLHPRLAHDERFRERFLREARAASKIRHPNVVQILDFGKTPQDSVYFVMEYLEGRDLRSLVKESGALPWSRARPLLLQAVGALKAAHGRGIIHRDIKPANCFLYDFEGEGSLDALKVLDFGIAKTITSDEDDQGLTGTGEVFGTATYMAPEQAHGEELDARSDIYSFGIMAYEVVVGRVPFTGANPIHIITRHLSEQARPPRELAPSLPAEAEALILKAIAKRPSDRFQSMAELGAALRATPSEDGAVSSVPQGTERLPTGASAVVTDHSGSSERTEVAQTPLLAQDTTYPSQQSGAPSVEPPPSAGPPTGDPYAAPEPARNSTRPPPDEPDVATTPHTRAPALTFGASHPAELPAQQVADTNRMLADTGERKKPPVALISVGILAIFGLSIGGGVLLFAGGDGDEAPAVADASGQTPPASNAAVEELPPSDERPIPDGAGADSSGAPPAESASASGHGDGTEVDPAMTTASSNAEGDPSAAPMPKGEGEPAPETTPTASPATVPRTRKAAPKKTDESVKKRLLRTIKRKCSAGHEGTRVSVELTVGSKGNILHKIVSASGALKSCISDQLRGAPFPEGSARQVKLSTEL